MSRSGGGLAADRQAAIERGRTHMGARRLAVEPAHCRRVATPPRHHRDPFDPWILRPFNHMLIAQALCENMILIGKDSACAEYPVEVSW